MKLFRKKNAVSENESVAKSDRPKFTFKLPEQKFAPTSKSTFWIGMTFLFLFTVLFDNFNWFRYHPETIFQEDFIDLGIVCDKDSVSVNIRNTQGMRKTNKPKIFAAYRCSHLVETIFIWPFYTEAGSIQLTEAYANQQEE